MSKMRVAIMGAGLSGLACALELEKHGIEPFIFEKRAEVGDRFVNGEILLSLMSRPVKDCIAYFSEQHELYLYPASNIQKMVIFSEQKKAEIHGHLGFNNVRGRESDSFEKQLGRQVKSPITFHSEATYEQLLQEYTHVVLATGDGEYATKLKNYRTDFTVSMKGATVEGDFDKTTTYAWFNNDYAPKGYAYLIPLSEKEANLVIASPDYPDTLAQDKQVLWELFFSNVCREFQQTLRITDQFQINRYPVGICQSPRVGNTFFVGNCFGSLMPFLGFGQFAAMLTGIYAAHDLCGLGNYEELTLPLRKSYENSLVLRRTMELLSNQGFDQIVQFLSGPLGEKLLNAKKLDILRAASILLRPWLKVAGP